MKKLIVAVFLMTISYIIFMKIDLNNLGLRFLSWIKVVQGKNVDLDKISNDSETTISHELWNDLLSKNVTSLGRVDYKGFIKAEEKLQLYLDSLSQYPPPDNTDDNYKLAYWINAYNAFTVKLIIDNYPLESIKDISKGLPMINSPWDIKFFEIGGISFDLNTIEHEILRKEFEEPRIHFAINCASISCPKLLNEAYSPALLEQQLNKQTIDFLSNKDKNKVSNETTELSKLFNWFKADFDKVGGIKKFISSYVELNSKLDIKYMDYNWSLNI